LLCQLSYRRAGRKIIWRPAIRKGSQRPDGE
jgi:hypothetical protein